MAGTPCKDHQGNEYPSQSAMCRAYEIPTSTNEPRRDKLKWSLENCLTIKPKNHQNAGHKCKDHLGKEFESQAAMCEHWN